jgi:hypothetical protein
MRDRRVFIWTLFFGLGVQLVFYVRFWTSGTESVTHALNDYGTSYLRFYSVAVDALSALLDRLGVGGGLETAVFVDCFAPLLGIVVSSAIFALGILVLYSAFSGGTQHRETPAA